MNVEDLIQRSTIEFDKPLSLDEMQELFGYLALHLSGEVRYKVERERIVGNIHEPEEGYLRTTGMHLSGDVSSTLLITAHFDCPTAARQTRLFDRLQFCTAGYDGVQGIRPEILTLMDDVRGHITEYIESRIE